MSGPALLAQCFLQLTCILLACRSVGWLAVRVGQPRVVAEMVRLLVDTEILTVQGMR